MPTAALPTLTLATLLHAAPQGPADALAEFIAEPKLDGSRIGVMVVDLADDRVLCSNDAAHGFMTASNMKLISSAVALRTLGDGFRYRTTLIATGPVSDGVLEGDLVLSGSGDPTFGGRQEADGPRAPLVRMVDAAIASHGLRRITGDVLGDDDCQPDEVMGEGWAWNYQGDGYAAQVGGLCFAENCVVLDVQAAADGRAPTTALIPPTGYFELVNSAVTAADVDKTALWAERLRATNRIRLGGRIGTGAERWRRTVSVENPTAYAATILLEVLRDRGVEVTGRALDRDELPERPERYGDETVLAAHDSATLGEILVTLNKVSQNLYAEQVLRTASRHAMGDAGMTSATAHAKATLRELGVDPTGMRIADGSGLTRLNLVRPHQLTALLTGIWRSEMRDSFIPTLPIAGVDGTIGRRFQGGPAAGRVLAKTGTISSVAALSGYVVRQDEGAPPLVFSILLNNFTCRSAEARGAMDRFVEALVRHVDA